MAVRARPVSKYAQVLAIAFFALAFWNLYCILSRTNFVHQNRPYEDLNDCLIRVANVRGVKIHSQNDEDGALLQTLRCMGGHGTKEYFEFGSESGSEVNTRVLRDFYGWHGHLLDGFHENLEIPLHKEFFTPSNIVSLLQKYNVNKNLDVLSVDADYDDFYITREILLAGYRPRVLINEYNTNFGADWTVSVVEKPIDKEKDVFWKGGCYFGASALAFIELVKVFGYTPVFPNHVNLIFIQTNHARDRRLMIPSVDSFPGLTPTLLHSPCQNRIWKNIDPNILQTYAADSTISHSQFAQSFGEINLTHRDSGEWRIFQRNLPSS